MCIPCLTRAWGGIELAMINSEFEHLLNERTARLLRRLNLHLSEVHRHSARMFIKEPNFGRHSLANLVEACIRAGFDPPYELDSFEASSSVAEVLRRTLATARPPETEKIIFKDANARKSAESLTGHFFSSPTEVSGVETGARFQAFTLDDIVLEIEEMLDQLGNERLQAIASHRLLLAEPMTLAELGLIYGVTRERIRQLQVKAARRLRGISRHNDMVRACEMFLRDRCTRFEEAFSVLHAHLRGISREDTAITLTATLLGVFCDAKSFGMTPKRAYAEASALLQSTRRAEWRAERDRHKEETRQTKRAEFFSRMMAAVRWPEKAASIKNINGLPERSRARQIDISDDEFSSKGHFASSRNGYGDVYFESSLEKTILETLDVLPQYVDWYCEQPLSIDYYDQKGRKRSYFPDILAIVSNSMTVLIECKPVQRMVHLDTYVKAKAATEFSEARGWGYVIVDDRGVSLRRLIEREQHASERHLLELFDRSSECVPAGRFFRSCRENGLGGFDITSSMLRLDLAYDTTRHVIARLPSGSWRELTQHS